MEAVDLLLLISTLSLLAVTFLSVVKALAVVPLPHMAAGASEVSAEMSGFIFTLINK